LHDFSEIAINAGEQQPISTGLIKPEHHFVFDMQHLFTYTTTKTDNHSAAQIEIDKELMW